MSETFRATLRVTGAGRLTDFGETLRRLMVRDIDAEPYTEHHAEGRLEYRFEIRKGIPFHAFAKASEEFPELRVEADWEDAARGLRGRAVIENGRLIEQASEALGAEAAALDVDVADDGRLVLAMACAPLGGATVGYAASAERHAYFSYRDGVLRLAPEAGERWEDGERLDDELLARVEEIAFGLAADWLWYDEEPVERTAVERARYADYGYPVRSANLRAAQLARLRQAVASGGALRCSTLGADGLRLRAALLEALGAGART